MTLNSRTTVLRYNHFGDCTPPVRVLTVGESFHSTVSDFEFVKADYAAAGECSVGGGECWLVDAGKFDATVLARVARSGLPLVVRIGDAGFDPALLDAADGHVLPDDDGDIIAAVVTRAIAGTVGLRVADLSDGAARTMQALSIEASRIAERLATLAATEAATAPAVRGIDAVLVRRIIKLRRERDRFLPAEILADPAWDILLDLTAARLEGKAVPVSSLCIAAAVPTTTALRWIRSLTEAGLLQRRLDTQDGRRSHVELADTAAEAMFGYLRAFNDVFALR